MFTIMIEFADGQDCARAEFRGVVCPDDTAAHEWAYRIAMQMGLKVNFVTVTPF